MTLREMQKQAYILNSNPDIEFMKDYYEGFWDRMMDDLIWASAFDGVHLAAGEGNLIVETRRPAGQTADFAQVTQTTTSKNWLPQDGTALMYGKGYWDLGKEWRFSMFGKMTTGTTPGNHTTEIRQQAAQPITDAGGSILATTSAVAAGATKSNISFMIFGHIQGRAAVGTAAAMFAWGVFMSNQLSVILPAANIPQMIPESAAASVNIDTTAAGGISLQGKNSGANASTVTIHDLNVQAIS